ncbi:MAG: TonB-dependent receptor plug domain-containing protein, partial [Gemmatimonadota bacterium]
SAYHAERGIPAELHVSEPRFWRYPEASRLFTVVAGGTGLRKSPVGGVGDVELSIGTDIGRTRIDEFASRAYDGVTESEESEDHNLTVRMRADQSLGAAGELRAGLTYADVNHDELLTPGGAASYRQRLWSGALEGHWQLSDLLRGTRVSIGIAIDGADTPESGAKPALGALTEWGARAGFTSPLGASVVVHAGASRRARFPSLRELYSGALGRFEPNPQLRPEQLVALEAGASLAMAHRAQLQAVLFHHVLSDAIVRVALGNRKLQRVNRDRQAGTGVELLAALMAGELSMNADLVVQRTRLEDPGTGTTMVPEYQPAVLAGAGVAGPLPLDLRFDLFGRYTAAQQCVNPDTGGATRIAASQRFDAEVSRRWSSLEVAAGLDNLTDEAIYDQCGLPQAGRTLRIQLRFKG